LLRASFASCSRFTKDNETTSKEYKYTGDEKIFRLEAIYNSREHSEGWSINRKFICAYETKYSSVIGTTEHGSNDADLWGLLTCKRCVGANIRGAWAQIHSGLSISAALPDNKRRIESRSDKFIATFLSLYSSECDEEAKKNIFDSVKIPTALAKRKEAQ
jgi:hypothetical protein